jgi:hypothetical protein
MRPSRSAQPQYLAALKEIFRRIEQSLADVPKQVLPIQLYLAGGAALHLYTGGRISNDVDASFSHRIALPEDLEVSYRDADGRARLLYFDRQYNDTLGLLHEDVYDDSVPLSLPDADSRILDVRLLSPTDLAVSKLGRFGSQDREDIATLARHKLIQSAKLRARAEDALIAYVGDLARVRGSIEIAVRIVSSIEDVG